MDTQNDTQEPETDSLSADLAAAIEHVEAGGQAPDETTLEIDTQEDAKQTAKDAAPDGQGEQTQQATSGQDETRANTGEAATNTAESGQDRAAQENQQEPDRTDAAPSSWKRETAEKWAELPAEVKAEIQRRETEYHKGIEQYKPAVQFAQEMNAAITPYFRNIQASGVPAPQAMNHLLMIEDKLRNGDEQAKLQTLVKIAADYGIDLQKAGQTQHDPRMWQMEQQLQQERMMRETYQRSQADHENQAVISEIEAFAQAQGHEHFEAVKQDMAQMLQSGMAQSLQDAYDKAVWMRPDIRQSLVQRTDAKQAAEQQRQARAKSAAGGVKGAANPKATTLSPDASLRDTLNAAIDGNL